MAARDKETLQDYTSLFVIKFCFLSIIQCLVLQKGEGKLSVPSGVQELWAAFDDVCRVERAEARFWGIII